MTFCRGLSKVGSFKIDAVVFKNYTLDELTLFLRTHRSYLHNPLGPVTSFELRWFKQSSATPRLSPASRPYSISSRFLKNSKNLEVLNNFTIFATIIGDICTSPDTAYQRPSHLRGLKGFGFKDFIHLDELRNPDAETQGLLRELKLYHALRDALQYMIYLTLASDP